MSSTDMPPMTGSSGSKKKKKREAVQPIQQVQPQPQKPPSPEPLVDVSLADDSDKDSLGKKDEIYSDSFNQPASIPIPVAPPRHSSSNTTTSTPPMGSVTTPSPRVTPIKPLISPRQPRERTPSLSYNKGQVVRGQPIPVSSIVSTVAELVHETIPIQSAAPTANLAERVEWVQIYSIDKAGDSSRRADVIVMGLTRGFQIWIMNENGDCEEVISERQGPLKCCILLPNNGQLDAKSGGALRPILALVDATCTIPDRQFCTVSLVSLATGNIIHRFPLEETVSSIAASEQFLVISLASSIVVYDITNTNYRQIGVINVTPPQDGCPPVYALNEQLLAYADPVYSVENQSCGGIGPEGEEPTAYAFQVMKVFKNTMNTLGDTVGASSGKTREMPKGFVTIIDLTYKENEERKNNIIAHFAAHMGSLTMLSWSPDGRLILSIDVSGDCFNLFLIMPHAFNPSLSSVQHLYRIHRGSTPAKVISTSFTQDCRWLAVWTNHGTAHIFAINPYGGKASQRTHNEHFSNKESRFSRSAGLSSGDGQLISPPNTSSGRSRTHSGTNPANKEHPSLLNPSMARSAGNPRIGPHPPPVVITATKKIKQRISADNLSAWATDLTAISSLVTSKKTRSIEPTRMSLSFSSRSSSNSTPVLLMASADGGIVCEYHLRPRKTNPSNPDDPPKLDAEPISMWTLQRTKNNADIGVRLQAGSPLMIWATKDPRTSSASLVDDGEQWIHNVEGCTYSGPHRRLWQGPQFSFFEYKEDITPTLMSPSDANRHSFSSIKSIPVAVVSRGSNDGRDIVPRDATRIECGSYSSEASISMTDADISSKIADAMRDVDFNPNYSSNGNAEEFYDTHSPSVEEKRRLDPEEDLLQFEADDDM